MAAYVAYCALNPHGIGAGIFQCPWHLVLGLDCPGCGITRAAICLGHLDLAGSLRYNPLSILVFPYAGYRILEVLFGAATKRHLVADWPRWFVQGYQWAFIAGSFCLGGYRVVMWIRQF